MDGVTSLNATTDSDSKIDINIILPDYLTCLVRKGRLNATICHAPKNGSECNEAESDCVDVIVSGDPVPFENLTSGTTYCFVVTLSSVNSSWKLSRQFTTNKDASVTTVHSLITTGASLSLKPNVSQTYIYNIHHFHTVQACQVYLILDASI